MLPCYQAFNFFRAHSDKFGRTNSPVIDIEPMKTTPRFTYMNFIIGNLMPVEPFCDDRQCVYIDLADVAFVGSHIASSLDNNFVSEAFKEAQLVYDLQIWGYIPVI
ncbi:hypothetical protein DFP85_10161 [Halomonas ventosae]|uniref:Uncharacterized protein n=1 Tax=Halomonas ventosae TaxID=229007 RepID=A0A4V3DQS0_9GAMM|nr:hypothetical protein DFP85_10161 [Halomonas ventosae]